MHKDVMLVVILSFGLGCLAAFSSASGAELEPNKVYCKVEPKKFERGGGFWGFLKDTTSCEVHIDTSYNLDLDKGDDDISLTIEAKVWHFLKKLKDKDEEKW
jgi:hypothetical protein